MSRPLGTEGSALNGIQVVSPADVWAVGQTQEANGAISTLTEHFTGEAWVVSPSPDPGTLGTISDNSLDSVASAGGTDLVAVGVQALAGHGLRTLAIDTTPRAGRGVPHLYAHIGTRLRRAARSQCPAKTRTGT